MRAEVFDALRQVAVGMRRSGGLRPLERWLREPVDGLERQPFAYVLGVAPCDPDHLPRHVGDDPNATATSGV